MTCNHNCPDSQMLTKYFFDKSDETITSHVINCKRCTDELNSIAQMISFTKEVTNTTPSEMQSSNMWEGISAGINHSSENKNNSKLIVITASSIAAILILSFAVYFIQNRTFYKKNPIKESVYNKMATIQTPDNAKFSIIDPEPDEIIRLSNGTITVHVKHLNKNERFRVITGNATIEVRGTIFEVIVKKDKLISVNVMEGMVEVNHEQNPIVLLTAGQHWNKPGTLYPALNTVCKSNTYSSSDINTANMPKIIPPKFKYHDINKSNQAFLSSNNKTDKIKPLKLQNTSNKEIAFNKGWKLLNSGATHEAIAHFLIASQGKDNNKLKEDAQFWLAVAYDKSGSKNLSAYELQKFINLYPDSIRIKEASAMLGWKMLEINKFSEAKKLFNTAITSLDVRIRNSALQGLTDLKKLKSNNTNLNK